MEAKLRKLISKKSHWQLVFLFTHLAHIVEVRMPPGGTLLYVLVKQSTPSKPVLLVLLA